MASLAARIWKECKAVTSNLSVENFAIRFEHLSAELAAEVTRFRHIEVRMGIERPSRHGCHPKRRRRPNLDPTIEQILPFIDELLDKLQIDQEQFELYDEGRWGDGIDPKVQSLSKSMFFGLPLPEKPRDHFQVRLTRYKQRYNPVTLLPWALEGARNMEEKINKLGPLLDDLEDIVRAVHDSRLLIRASFSTARQSTSSDTQPPPTLR